MRNMKELPYHIGMRIKIYLSYKKKHLVAVNDGAKRAVYNHLVACGNERYYLSKTAEFVPSDRERIGYLEDVSFTSAGVKNALPFLYGDEVDSLVVDNAIANYHKAWKNMKELHTGVPTFKKKSYEQSYQTNAHYKYKDEKNTTNVRFLDEHHVTLPKLGRVRFDGSPEIVRFVLEHQDTIRIGTIAISRDAVGEYWASFSLASEQPFYGKLPGTGSMRGIDLNLIDLVNGSDGQASPNMHYYVKSQGKLARQQRSMCRKRERAKREGRNFRESKSYQEKRKQAAYTSRKAARQRKDYLNVLSKHEVENQDFIAAEDLQVRNMVKNHCLAKAISDAGWRTLLTMLDYKAGFYGRTFVKVPPQYTTQTCSHCGHVMRGEISLTLADREWTCPVCGTHHDRDTNSGKNILAKALAISGWKPQAAAGRS